MKDFNQAQTGDTPSIDVDLINREVTICGKCFPANAREFFGPFRDWFDNYLKECDAPIKFKIDLEYFNTSSSLVLLEIMRQLVLSKNCDKDCIHWIYEEGDDDIEEAGIEYNHLLNNRLKVISKPERKLAIA